MNNIKILACSGLLAVASSVMAADNVPIQVASTLGNTLYYETVDGNFRMYIQSSADGTYRVQSSMKMNGQGGEWRSMSGHWKVEGDRLCRYQDNPAPPADRPSICEPYADYPAKVGDSASGMGGKMKISLLQGEVSPKH